MNTLRCFAVLVAIFLAACSGSQQPSSTQPADLVIKNGNIYTADGTRPKAEAVAVKGGRIVYVGSSDSVQAYIGDSTEVIDLGGKTMTPGFIESHGHFLSVGYNKMNLDLSKATNYEELVQMVAGEVKKRKPGEWILGRGWHQSKWLPQPDPVVKGFQTHHKLSAVSPDNPVWLTHASGHAGFANAKAMEIAGVLNDRTTQVEGGEVIRDAKGEPTGIFNEVAKGLISKHVPDNTVETDRKAQRLAVVECLRLGITSFQDAGSGRQSLEVYRKGLENGELGVRLYVMLSTRDKDLVRDWLEKTPEVNMGNNFLTVRAIKIHADGALGSRGAWLLEPYSDRPETSGMATEDMTYVLEVSEKALQKGYQVCSHAIGDRTNREILDRYEQAFKKYPERSKDHRFRIEHAQHIDPADIPRFGALGVIASMQGIHMASDRPWAIDRLGEKRITNGAYVWRKLLETGAVIINGTDAPVEPLDPMPSFYASVTRKTLKGEPEGGYEPGQKMTREEALRSYTLDAAYGAFEETMKGSVTVGKLADFTVWSQDLMTVPDSVLPDTKAVMTVVDGKVSERGLTRVVSSR